MRAAAVSARSLAAGRRPVAPGARSCHRPSHTSRAGSGRRCVRTARCCRARRPRRSHGCCGCEDRRRPHPSELVDVEPRVGGRSEREPPRLAPCIVLVGGRERPNDRHVGVLRIPLGAKAGQLDGWRVRLEPRIRGQRGGDRFAHTMERLFARPVTRMADPHLQSRCPPGHSRPSRRARRMPMLTL